MNVQTASSSASYSGLSRRSAAVGRREDGGHSGEQGDQRGSARRAPPRRPRRRPGARRTPTAGSGGRRGRVATRRESARARVDSRPRRGARRKRSPPPNAATRRRFPRFSATGPGNVLAMRLRRATLTFAIAALGGFAWWVVHDFVPLRAAPPVRSPADASRLARAPRGAPGRCSARRRRERASSRRSCDRPSGR